MTPLRLEPAAPRSRVNHYTTALPVLFVVPFFPSSFAIVLKVKGKLVALLLLSYRCIFTVNVLWLFLTVQWAGLQCVIVEFPDHTHLLFDYALFS